MKRVEVCGLGGVEKRESELSLVGGCGTAIRILSATLTISLRSDRGNKDLMNEKF